MGKVVLARLLQQCDCRRVYVLLRPPSGGTATERLHSDVFMSGVFDELKKQHGLNFSSFVTEKVHALAGDLLKPDLGISNAEEIQNEVSAVIHMAASVHFNSPLSDNYRSNVEGSLRVLDFCRKCKNLQVLVHTSTCYVNSDLRGTVKEGIIPMPWDAQTVHLAVRRLIELTKKVKPRLLLVLRLLVLLLLLLLRQLLLLLLPPIGYFLFVILFTEIIMYFCARYGFCRGETPTLRLWKSSCWVVFRTLTRSPSVCVRRLLRGNGSCGTAQDTASRGRGRSRSRRRSIRAC